MDDERVTIPTEKTAHMAESLKSMLNNLIRRRAGDGDYTVDDVKKMAEALESLAMTEAMLAGGDAPDFATGMKFDIKQEFDAADPGREHPKGPDGK